MTVPFVVSLLLWLVTGSALVLAFAVLGPLALLAQRFDSVRAARFQERDQQVSTKENAAAGGEFERRATAWQRACTVRDIVESRAEHLLGSMHEIVLGECDGHPLCVPAALELNISGDKVPRGALERSVRVQQQHARGAGDASAREASVLTDSFGAHVEVESLTRAAFRHGLQEPRYFRPHLLGRFEAAAEPDPAVIESHEPDGQGGLPVVIGTDSAGARLSIDLVRGPHAIVAGASGSGKCELLRRWIYELCQSHDSIDLNLVLIDFKGGSGFAAYAEQPHVVSFVTDLDDFAALRTLRLIRALLGVRELELSKHNARDISQLAAGTMPRLVVFIDEYQLLVERAPELHQVVADVAARGRSLGVHLVLATQHPSRSIRDNVLANAGLRIAFRLLDRSESQMLLDTQRAVELRQTGEAVIHDEHGSRLCEVTPLTDEELAAAAVTVSERLKPALAQVFRPIPDGHTVAQFRQYTDSLLVSERVRDVRTVGVPMDRIRHVSFIGPAQSGRSVAVARAAQLAKLQGQEIISATGSLADRWVALDRASRQSVPTCLIVDDVDDLLVQLDSEYRLDVLRKIRSFAADRLNRVVLSARAPTPLDELCDSHITLTGRNGQAQFNSEFAQVVWASPLPADAPPVRRWNLHRSTIVVTRHTAAVVNGLTQAGSVAHQVAQRADLTAELLSEFHGSEPIALVATADTWMALAGSTERLVELNDVLFVDGRYSDLRAVLRPERLPPLLDGGESWLASNGTSPVRVRCTFEPGTISW